ncbi:MAG: site-specific integrase, partial [Pikeienuella sp.]
MSATATEPPPPSGRLIALFLDAMRAERGAAENTILAYARDLAAYAHHVEAAGGTLIEAGRDAIESWLSALEEEGRAPATRARALSSARQLHRFLYDDGWREDDHGARIAGPRKSRPLPKTLSVTEVDALLDAAGKAGPRARCLMELLYATGMRVSEMVSLPVAAARGDPKMILVKGKGGKERLTPLSAPARAALDD